MRTLALALLLVLPTGAWAQSAEGLWRTEKTPKGASLDVRIEPCGEALCGTIAAAYGTDRTDLVGETLITGMRPNGPGHWADGSIVAPDTAKTYAGSMSLDGPALRVEGCAVMICRSQTWERLN